MTETCACSKTGEEAGIKVIRRTSLSLDDFVVISVDDAGKMANFSSQLICSSKQMNTHCMSLSTGTHHWSIEKQFLVTFSYITV